MSIATTIATPTAPPVNYWEDDDTAELMCRNVIEVTHDVKSFLFAAEDNRTFEFEPGQFITLDLEIDGTHYNRCYTISSPPTRPHLLAITVKRVPGGPVSNWLHDTIVPGSTLTVKAPLGIFTLHSSPFGAAEDVTGPAAWLPTTYGAKYLFLSAGSGITPMMSMTRGLFDLGSHADVLFVHNARTPIDIIFRRELESMAAFMPNLKFLAICEEDHPSERWTGLRGRITDSALMAIAPDLHERVIYACGPQPYMDAVRTVLTDRGFDLRNYHEESFSFDQLPGSIRHESPDAVIGDTDTDADGTAITYRVEFTTSGRVVRCGVDETILDAATAAGLRLPASCAQGMCGTCKAVKLEGDVDMNHNGGIRPKEVALGKILLCCSTPLSDLQIEA